MYPRKGEREREEQGNENSRKAVKDGGMKQKKESRKEKPKERIKKVIKKERRKEGRGGEIEKGT